MENSVLPLDATMSNVLPMYEDMQPSVMRSQSTGDNQKHPECITCHLCAIKVPRRFINEHYKSDKHKINAQIANVALDRVQKSLNCDVVSDIDKSESLFFCPQCVISMNSKERQNHEKSVVHKKALTVDRFLYDFYFLYANDANDDGNSDILKECEPTGSVVSNTVEPSNEIDNITKDIDNNKLLNISEKMEVKINDSVGETNKNMIKTNTIENDKNDPTNVASLKKIPNIPNTGTIDNSSIYNTSQFCTFGRDKNQIFCTTCKVYVPNKEGNIISHQNGFRHKEMLGKIKRY